MPVNSASSPRKRFGPSDKSTSKSKSKSNSERAPPTSYSAGPIPQSLFQNHSLNAAISTLLPLNYKFEIHKTIHHVRHFGSKSVALQMPEGLTVWATAIADIIETFTNATTVIMGDVTYGACCVDDYTALALGCDMLIHYGHSCLVPVDQTMIRTLYIFVEIAIDSPHLSSTIRSNFPSKRSEFRREILGIGSEEGKSHHVEKAEKKSKLQRIEIESQDEENVAATIESRFQETLNLNEKISNPSVEERSKEKDQGDDQDDKRPTHFALVATVQFIGALQGLKESLERFEPRPISNGNGRDRLMITDEEPSSSHSDSSSDSKEAKGASNPSERPWYSSQYLITVPQSKPLSPGEVLGCTSPNFTSSSSNKNRSSPDALIYLGDGRFHLESAMIANPRLPAFRYDPYSKTLVRERYDHERMRRERGNALDLARESVERDKKEKEKQVASQREVEKKLNMTEEDLKDRMVQMNHGLENVNKSRENSWGLILGTLGRQGSLKVLKHLQDSLILPSCGLDKSEQNARENSIPSIPILLSELSPQKLSLFGPNLSIFVQTSCPRLSIDWGNAFEKPLLSPYEATVALGRVKGWDRSDRIRGLGTKKGEKSEKERQKLESQSRSGNVGDLKLDASQTVEAEREREGEGDYPMDFYSDDSLGPWTPRFGLGIKKKVGGGTKNAFLLKKRNRNKIMEESVD